MARRAKAARKTDARKTKSDKARTAGRLPLKRRLRRLVLRGVVLMAGLVVVAVALFSVIDPPMTHTMWVERSRLGALERDWVDFEDIAPVMARSAVAAEDANFCEHWGFDMGAIRAAISEGAARGGSTISQQVVKNVYLWQERSWFRKGLEAGMTPMVEALWSKRRILEVYLNVAEFGEGVFGVEAAARHYFGVSADALSARQAALLAAVLPNPKERNAGRPSNSVDRRARSIQDGAATIAADGRDDCFEG
ncbi:monofunctional biosynthetic peptidoglycan transglycosylase [Sagittula sp. MA-2]|jgi:monofunctional biosynthetic peptidoglycan transglycosylase|uniref:monofunctional biosynthetic peptidoglycan transglycosylase n=1 Tax=Sagittula sp. MA-2 TaxID=3048007 RepID=UPI0024C371F8|nr:monofunctional biosynthetic peptidoglycan transglycosylase [Sagittula sp. MA-2]WHZ35821.1 monofunctional biosynthetic peptidoglycan transglycosylase [Sagittula sp. MA-2]